MVPRCWPRLATSAAATDLNDPRAPRKIAAQRRTPTEAEAVGKVHDRVTLSVAKLKDRNAPRAKEAWKFGDQSADHVETVGPAIEGEARLRCDRDA